MAKAKKFSGKQLDELYVAYDTARRTAKEAENDKRDAADEIKTLLGDIQEANTANYIVTYKYDKDQSVFDKELLQKKNPKGYEKYEAMVEEIETITTKYVKTVKGARKLVVTAVAE